MLARRLAGRRMRIASAPELEIGLLTHVNNRLLTVPSGYLAYDFSRLSGAPGAPVLTQLPDLSSIGSILPAGSHQHGTITLQGRNMGAGALDFGGSEVAAMFRCNALGMENTPVEVFPYKAAPATATTYLARHLAVRGFTNDQASTATVIQVKDLRTGAVADIDLLMSKNVTAFANLGDRVLALRNARGSQIISDHISRGTGVQTASQRPLGIYSLTHNRNDVDANENGLISIINGLDAPTSMVVDLRDFEDPAPAFRYVRFWELNPVTGGTIQRSVRNGAVWLAAEVHTYEVVVSGVGSAEDFDQGGLYTYKLYPCTVALRAREGTGLVRISRGGEAQFFPWFSRHFEDIGPARLFTGEVTTKATGVTTPPTGNPRYFKPGPTDWPELPSTPWIVDIDNPRPTTGPNGVYAAPDRLVVMDSSGGRILTYGYDGSFLTDHSLAGANQRAVVTGEGLIVATGGTQRYSRDWGATWTTASNLPYAPSLSPTKLF